MGKRAVIFGAGGHAQVIASIIEDHYGQLMFVTTEKTGTRLTEEEFFARRDEYRDAHLYIGIGSNESRKRIYDRLRAVDFKIATCISSHAVIARDAEIGDGAVICPGAVIMTRARLGHNVIVNTLSSVDHDCVVGNHSYITAGVTFGGNTRVGESCFFGIKSATIQGVTVGDNSIVMAGSLVTGDVPPNVVVGGYPARIVKKREPSDDLGGRVARWRGPGFE